MVYGGEEFFNVAFQYPTNPSIVFTDLPCHFLKSINTFIGTSIFSARIRVGIKCRLEYFFKHSACNMVDNSVSYTGFVNKPQFRISYNELAVVPGLITSFNKRLVEIENVIF